MNQKVKTRLNLNNSASPRGKNRKASDATVAKSHALKLSKKVKSNINKHFKMSRLKGLEFKHKSNSKDSAKSKESTRDKTSPKSNNMVPQSFSAQATSKFPRISKLSKTRAEQIAELRRKLLFPA